MPDLAMLDYFYGDEAEQFTFYRIPKVLFTDPSYRRISSDAKILYGLMLDRMGLSVRNGWLDEYNRVFIFFTLEDALEYLCCGHTKAVSLFGELDKAGLIERKKQGQGKPTKIYVKNFVRNAEVLTSEKRKSKVPQSGSQDFQKTASNNSDTVVRSGCMAKDADMILSEFILLGIGGKELSEENAIQTAKALNVIQPDFIRVHATGIKPESKLGEFVRDGSFTLQSEEEIVIEQKMFLQQLQAMDSYYVNEHIINLLLEVRGNLRTEKQEMLSAIDRFLSLSPDEKLLFTIGRRLNIFFLLDDLKKPELHKKAEESLKNILGKSPDVDFVALCNYIRQSQI